MDFTHDFTHVKKVFCVQLATPNRIARKRKTNILPLVRQTTSPASKLTPLAKPLLLCQAGQDETTGTEPVFTVLTENNQQMASS